MTTGSGAPDTHNPAVDEAKSPVSRSEDGGQKPDNAVADRRSVSASKAKTTSSRSFAMKSARADVAPEPDTPENQSATDDTARLTAANPEPVDKLPDEVAAYLRIVGTSKLQGIQPGQASGAFYESWTYSTDRESTQSVDTPIDPLLAPSGAKDAKVKKKKKRKAKARMEIAHQTSGRVRLKVAAGKNDPDLLKQIAESFSAIPGMERITVSPVTGSIILNYNEDNQKAFNDRLMHNLIAQGAAPMIGSEFEELARKIENQAEFLAERSKTARAVVDFCKRLDREIKVATHNVVDLKIIIAVGVIVLTILEVGANAATPIWLTLSIFTFNHFVELHNPVDLETAPVKAPVVFR